MSLQSSTQTPNYQLHNEQILVVPRDILFQECTAWHGLNKEAFTLFIFMVDVLRFVLYFASVGTCLHRCWQRSCLRRP